MNLQIAENLRRLRQERNMTQSELADQLGVSYQAVSRWENKSSYPDIELLPAIASLFGVTVDYLLGSVERHAGREWWDTWNRMQNPADRLLHLRQMHRAFPEDQEVFFRLCESITDRDECYRLTEEFIAQCPIPFFRAQAIRHMIHVEYEERVLQYLGEKNIPEEAWGVLLEDRYRARGDMDRLRKKSQWNLNENIRHALIRWASSSINEPCVNPSEGVTGARTVLAIITAITDSHLTDEHPVAGDGGPDLWYHERIWAGITLACAESACGHGDAAITLLSDAADLLSCVRHMDKDKILSYRTPNHETLDRPRSRCVTYYGEQMERSLSHPAFDYLQYDSRYAEQFALCKQIFTASGDADGM